jgi:protein-L-isoaspartate(D-aspartate) O-methyltransferase
MHNTTSMLAILTGWMLCATSLAAVRAQPAEDPYSAARNRLVDQAVEGEGITNEAVLQAMRKVPRHEFVPPGLRSRAYRDEALAIGSSQTISPPYIVAFMTETLDPQPDDSVLEIGTGSGYQAAVLAEIVREVYSIEIVRSLAQSAERRLKKLNYDNVRVKAGDGYQGWPEHAPFDRIIVTCSPETVPAPLIEQLKDGGTMIIPIGERYQQAFYLFRKQNGELQHERLSSTLFVPMTGESEEHRRIQPDANSPQLENGGFEVDENDDGRADGWHYQRRSELVSGSPVQGGSFIEFNAENEGELAQALQGLAVNGRTIGFIEVSMWAQTQDLKRGSRGERAGVIVHFYDGRRVEIATQPIAFWDNDMTWKQIRRRIAVPARARELILRIGLNGATGILGIDDIRLKAGRR